MSGIYYAVPENKIINNAKVIPQNIVSTILYLFSVVAFIMAAMFVYENNLKLTFIFLLTSLTFFTASILTLTPNVQQNVDASYITEVINEKNKLLTSMDSWIHEHINIS